MGLEQSQKPHICAGIDCDGSRAPHLTEADRHGGRHHVVHSQRAKGQRHRIGAVEACRGVRRAWCHLKMLQMMLLMRLEQGCPGVLLTRRQHERRWCMTSCCNTSHLQQMRWQATASVAQGGRRNSGPCVRAPPAAPQPAACAAYRHADRIVTDRGTTATPQACSIFWLRAYILPQKFAPMHHAHWLLH
jgi:hypothetical protein